MAALQLVVVFGRRCNVGMGMVVRAREMTVAEWKVQEEDGGLKIFGCRISVASAFCTEE